MRDFSLTLTLSRWERGPGPHDSEYLFDRFLDLVAAGAKAVSRTR